MIAVIIPTYNRSDLLKNAIQSVLSQTYKDIEIIVVDDASTCNNQEVIENFKLPIIYHRFEMNQGGNICRNKGVELASGEYIAFLDDDDTWNKEKLERQYRLMSENSIDLCYTGKNIITVDEKLNELNRRYSYTTPKFNNLIKSIMQKNFIGSTSSIMLKKDKFLKVDGFDINMPALQDYEFYIRFIHNNFTVAGIDEGLVDYFIYQKKNAVSKSLKKNIQAIKQILQKNKSKKYLALLLLEFTKITLKKILRGH
jgi:glycosyltransferase involved in cell wall biosynthesis